MNLNFLYTAISWLLLRWHDLWGAAFGFNSGVAWALSIVFLVVTVRLVLFPLFVKQIHSQRKMSELQPQVKELQKKYKNDKETMQRELMKLYRENNANPVAGCLPLLLQAPVFLSLFHVLRRLDPTRAHNKTLYGWTDRLFDSASNARIFGAPISAHFSSTSDYLAKVHASATTVKLVTGVLVAIMVVTTYVTQRQLMARQTQSVDTQQQMVQRVMLYGVPASLLISGSLFPLGVVLYWCTTNLWSMGQQFYVLKRMPPPPGAKPKSAEELRQTLSGEAATARALAPPPGARPPATPRRPSSGGQQRRAPSNRPGRSRKGGRR